MPASARKFPTDPDAFIAWENRRKRRYELILDEVRLMAGGTLRHNRLALNLAMALTSRVAERNCFVHSADVKVRSPAGMVTYPDVFVRCGPADQDATEVDDPVAIFEVLSPSTRGVDLVRKRHFYQAIHSLIYLVYIESVRVHVEVVTRESDGSWRGVFLSAKDAVVALANLGVEIPLEEIYTGTDLS